jgi:hypothetical protein
MGSPDLFSVQPVQFGADQVERPIQGYPLLSPDEHESANRRARVAIASVLVPRLASFIHVWVELSIAGRLVPRSIQALPSILGGLEV